MTRRPQIDSAYYRELLGPLVKGRRVVVIGGVVAGLVPLARQLRALGSERPFLLAADIGTGPLPEPEEAEWLSLDVPGSNPIDAMRAYEAVLGDLPPAARAALERYDPDGDALVLGAILLTPVPEVAGRRRYGRRPDRWAALEDKVAIDPVWDAIGIPRAPCEVVPVERAALRRAARRLDRGSGTVWAGDARDGVHGAAEYVRWVRDEGCARQAEQLFARCCDRVRVMPFLEGIPCSIHGIVLPDGVAVMRPVELMVLRRTGQSRFAYTGTASFWDPPPADREAMRATARRVGEALPRLFDYRGAFTVDGVLSEHGFLPTELNARIGAGLGMLAGSLPDLPLALLALAAVEGEPLDYRAADLEALVVTAADARRAGGGWTTLPRRRDSTEQRSIVERDGGYALAGEGERPDGSLLLGPSQIGGFVRFTPEPSRVPAGPSLAPRVAAALALADRALGTAIGPLEPARPAR